ncbi:ribose-phosphate pyrophosphokinase [bacterium]|nr:ribose-phosphate pyrophosphokinase [bacterium]
MNRYPEGPLIICGRDSVNLAQRVADCLKIQLGHAEIRKFSDDETFVRINDNVRGRDIFIVQSTHKPANENLMELLLLLDAARRASADRITAVIPYFGYARQDRKAQGRVALSAKLVANLVTTAGANRVLTIDLHSSQIQGFFDIPLDHLYAGSILLEHARTLDLSKAVVVSPDVGNVKLGRDYATRLGLHLVIIDKRRPEPNRSEVMAIIGAEEVVGRNVLIFDDLIDTAGTICNAAQALRERGARDVYALATHGVLSGPALDRLQEAPIKQIAITNTILQDRERLPEKIKILDVAPLLATAIDRIHKDSSVSALFQNAKP